MRISDISIVIPTKDRPDDLRSCIASIMAQNKVFPKEVVIVDAGSEGNRYCMENVNNTVFPVIWIKSDPGLTKQRNIGIAKSSGQIIAFLDDDCVVTDNYIESLEEAFKVMPDAGGIQGILINSKKRTFLKKLFTTMFFLTEIDGTGEMKRSGVPSLLDKHLCLKKNKPLRTLILHGAAMSYRRTVFEHGFLFNESLKGYSLGEDYEFSYKVSARFNLYVVPSVRLYHFESVVSRDMRNWYYQKVVNVFKHWKTFRFDAHPVNHFAFGLYVAGTMLQALIDCVRRKSFVPIEGWSAGLFDVLKLGG